MNICEQSPEADSPFRAPRSIRPDRRWIAHQEVARTAERVVRVRRLAGRRARVEVVDVIARRAAAAARTRRATRRRRTATRTAVPVTADGAVRPRLRTVARRLALAHAALAVHVTVRIPVAGAAPIRRAARRTVIRTGVIAGPTVVAAITVAAATVSARAFFLQIAAPPNRLVAAWAHRGPCLTRLATRVPACAPASVATTWIRSRTKCPAAGGR
jgi:hypothetical protein